MSAVPEGCDGRKYNFNPCTTGPAATVAPALRAAIFGAVATMAIAAAVGC